VLKRVKSLLIVILFVFGVSGAATGQTTNDTCARTNVEKIEVPKVWQPGPDGNQVPLWPESLAIQAPETDNMPETVGNGSKLIAGRTWNFATYVSRPTMTIYQPKGQNTRAAILVLPGGGYKAVAMDLEGTEICDWITTQGITCILLKYRVPQAWRWNEKKVGQRPEVLLALDDVQRAMGLLRHRASSYDIDPNKLGVIGFSAGGHLAAEVSNAHERAYDPVDAADRESSLPDFAILQYPGRLWDKSSPKTSLNLAPWVDISAKAPPTLLVHAMNDPVDDIRHSMAYGLALNDVGVPVDMRFYAKGCHAFGLRPTSDPITMEWPGLVMKWLQNINVL